MYLWLNIGTGKSRVTSEDNIKKAKMNWLLQYKDQISNLYTPKLKDLIGVEHLIILPDNLEELFLAAPYSILEQIFSLAYTTKVLFLTQGHCDMSLLKENIKSFYPDFKKI